MSELQQLRDKAAHPSYRQLNAKSRRYAGHEGEDAELAILRAVMV